MVARPEYLDGGHVVQFYGHEEELADRVTGYLLGALQHDGVAVVIATAVHRRAFEGRLTRAGVDLAAAARAGTYRTLDAGDTVRALTTGGQLDRGAFDRVIGRLIADAGQGARPVRAYGEMVALLWDAGLVNDAVQLEEMWGSLGLSHSFSLFCSYPARSVTGDGHLEAFAEVCRLHGSVVGGWPAPTGPSATRAPAHAAKSATRAPGPGSTTRAFALSGDAPAAARHFAVDAVRRLGAADLADDTALVVTELAANAIVHAQTGFTVDLSAGPDVLRITVRDASPLPPASAADLPALPLHGLGAVDALASRWGVERLGHSGKLVWVELRR
ncbi:MAG TPA: MEDS domain-containing protein [Streptosporangiaceae bacterium]|nr:MEDS domain-containing protein [Streptosporangiaceae bacterium]